MNTNAARCLATVTARAIREGSDRLVVDGEIVIAYWFVRDGRFVATFFAPSADRNAELLGSPVTRYGRSGGHCAGGRVTRPCRVRGSWTSIGQVDVITRCMVALVGNREVETYRDQAIVAV